jgi:hypothetical protein
MKTILQSLILVILTSMSCYAQFNENDPLVVSGEVTNPTYVLPKVSAVDSGYFVSYYDETDGYKMYLQFVDPKGNVMWDNPVVVTDYPQDSWISDYTLLTDDRFAYIFFSDARNGDTDKDIFGYKFDVHGSFLWDNAGIELIIGDSDYDSELAPKATVLTNGDVISAWNKMDAAGYTVAMQWLTPNGEKIWPDGNIVAEAGLRYYEPNLLPASDSTVFLVYIYQNGMYGNRQIHAQQIDTTGQNLWDSAIVITDNSGIGMGRTFSLQAAKDGGIYITWYGDPDFNGANDVYSQKLNRDGSVGFQPNGLDLSPNDIMNQTMPNCAGEDYNGNAVYVWQEVNGANTGDLIKTQLVSPSGELMLGEAAITISDQHNFYGKASYAYGNLYCPANGIGNTELQMIMYNYLNNDTSVVNMGMQFEAMSQFENGQFIIADVENESVRIQNISFRGESGAELLSSESTLSAFAGMRNFHPDTLFYYLPADSAHLWNDFATQMNIYQNIDLLDVLLSDAGNFRVNVYAEDGTYTTYQFSFVNEPGTEVESSISDYLLTYVEPESNSVYAEMIAIKENDQYVDLELTPGARLKIGDALDVDYAQLNDTLNQFFGFVKLVDSAFMTFNVVDYNGVEEEWTLIMTMGGGSISSSNFAGKVYPIPANDRIYVKSANTLREIHLIDLQGVSQLIEKVNDRNVVLPISNFPAGVYLLKLVDENKTSVKRVVIE